MKTRIKVVQYYGGNVGYYPQVYAGLFTGWMYITNSYLESKNNFGCWHTNIKDAEKIIDEYRSAIENKTSYIKYP